MMTSNEQISSMQPILFLDSGIGGLSILTEAKKAVPDAQYIYLADYAALPYGNKSEAEIAARVPALLGRAVERYRPRLITIACNTACTIALSHVRAALDVPIVGTVPAIKPAAALSTTKVIGILGTAATIRQPYVEKLYQQYASDCMLIRSAAPDLVGAAEAKMRGEDVPIKIYENAISNLLQHEQAKNMDVIILGCTHFPLVKDELSAAALKLGMAEHLKFIDGAQGISRRIDFLTKEQKFAGNHGHNIGKDKFFYTGENIDIEKLIPNLTKIGFTEFSEF
ncbi:glutamate racemase [Sphingorhabdus lutea]|uniref:Glutamate racemase n=1 Tax=Sphingorhabdus lutea TaxID=1913578 RepID=A0A1L3JBZ3_9SPHN|nr:glutamate racemase [Sphingorhabdus lutea]APG62642.1 glutamate racemase [Sphingorhabdus lutea]